MTNELNPTPNNQTDMTTPIAASATNTTDNNNEKIRTTPEDMTAGTDGDQPTPPSEQPEDRSQADVADIADRIMLAGRNAEPTEPEASHAPVPPEVSETGMTVRLEDIDDTSARAFPGTTSTWTVIPLEEEPAEEPEAIPTHRKIALSAAFAAVALTSFVAGGVTARLSSQMPVLFAQKAEQSENKASYTTPVKPAWPPEQEETEPVEEETPSEPTEREVSTTPQAPTTTPQSNDKDDELRWDLDRNEDRTISYDNDSDRVKVNYDGYSLTFDLDDLLDEERDTSTTTNDTNSYDNDSYINYLREYGYGTGYDTEEERDSYSWGYPQSYEYGYDYGYGDYGYWT